MLSFYPACISIPNPQKGGLFLFFFFSFWIPGSTKYDENSTFPLPQFHILIFGDNASQSQVKPFKFSSQRFPSEEMSLDTNSPPYEIFSPQAPCPPSFHLLFHFFFLPSFFLFSLDLREAFDQKIWARIETRTCTYNRPCPSRLENPYFVANNWPNFCVQSKS